ncbi:DUF4870 domain-containing protein [Halomarina oriensis]|uniref:DUF4870 domain-containing protein n=1 Tax=Halomarina oriensis TaxID=671145 RepID=A0A6B0GWM1_9EURY|nr:DUF4870 domain-containing protein [Halomarina oriensis]MWG36973.1 DUF4870 domain-containing protein [Halomarina oriensis]
MATQERSTAVESSETGLEPNVLAALSYVLGLVTGLIVYLLESDDEFVRFHAAQSMAVSVLLVGLSIVLTVFQTALFSVGFVDPAGFVLWSLLSLVFTLVGLVLWLGSFVAWVYLIVRAYQGSTPRIPIAAGVADRLV